MSEKTTPSSTKDTNNTPPPPATHETTTTENPPLFTGSCFCKTITFTLSSLPIKSYICHCLDCRRLTGTSFAHNIAFPYSSLSVSTNTNADGQTPDDSALKSNMDGHHLLTTFGNPQSGRRQFCSLCGTGLFLFGKVAEGEETERVIVQAGAVDGSHEDERLRPIEEGFRKRREGWMRDMVGTKVFEEWRDVVPVDVGKLKIEAE